MHHVSQQTQDGGTGIRMLATNEESASRTFRVRQWRRAAILVTLPGLVLGTGSIAAAFGVGLFDHSDKPVCTPERVPAPARSSFQLAVANAGETSGEATSVGRELTKRGFTVANVGNAPEGVYIKRAAMVYHGPEGLDQALLVASQIPGSRVYNDGRAGTSVEAVLGYGFKGLVKIPPAPPPLTSEITVNVYNTTWREGLASTSAEDLRARGFAIGTTGNDPVKAFLPNDIAVIRFGSEGLDAAKVLQGHVPGARMQQDDRTSKDVDLVLGTGYAALAPLSKVPVPPERPPLMPEMVARPCTDR